MGIGFFLTLKAALLIEYDGSNFAGWQIQPGVRTVQGELEASLKRITGHEIAVIGSGRTDAGVHATGMVAHIELPVSVDIPRFLLGINATTGHDVVVKAIRPTEQEFHARFDATSRSYRYTIVNDWCALRREHAWEVRKPLDPDRLTDCSRLLLGEHDFTSFSKSTEDVTHFRCTVQIAEWSIHGTQFAFRIQANRFVRGMVRALVGAMIQCGLGILGVDEFRRLLEHPQELDRAKYLAPPQGLVLEHVGYPDRYQLW